MTDVSAKLSERIKFHLLEKILSNRITIIVGPTGCGKSTLVPSFILHALGGKVLCSQPRRLAVVSVAKRVAALHNRDYKDGKDLDITDTDVGYHVGQHNESSSKRTKLLFVTAGILLEELRANGAALFEQYSCIIMDECHERSVESDICLVILTQLLQKKISTNLRIVLMSATFDHTKYKSYFCNNVPDCGHIDVVTLETAESFETYFNQVQTFYLDDILSSNANKCFPMLDQEAHDQLRTAMTRDPNIDLYDRYHELSSNGRKKTNKMHAYACALSVPLLRLIADMVTDLDQTEPDGAAFMIFAPTYRHLEQLYEMLQSSFNNASKNQQETNRRELQLSVLHSSVDIEDCLRSMKDETGLSSENSFGIKRRRILLASAIADSSITIPGVTCVIDTCRSLEVSWDVVKEARSSKTIWSSQSICDQRQGRTGRTCPGRVFRLLPKNFFLTKLQQFESPALQHSDCKNESLSLISAVSNDISNKLISKTLDPPDIYITNVADNYLQEIGACMVTGGKKRSKLVATDYGKLVAALPFQVSESQAILSAAKYGYLYEMILWQTIQTVRPLPIKLFFGDESSTKKALRRYYDVENHKDSVQVAMAHMSAFMHWDVVWNNNRRSVEVQKFDKLTGAHCGNMIKHHSFLSMAHHRQTWHNHRHKNRADCGAWTWSPEMENDHFAFCRKHQINPTSVQAIADTIDITLKILYEAKNEPEWLRCSHTEPLWRRKISWTEFNVPEFSRDKMIDFAYGTNGAVELCKMLQEITICSQLPLDATNIQISSDLPMPSNDVENYCVEEACIHFLNGHCRFGSQCVKSHSIFARPPMCKFFLAGKCTKGNECIYSHTLKAASALSVKKNTSGSSGSLRPCVPILKSLTLDGGAKSWFTERASSVLLVGECNFDFTRSLCNLYFPPYMTSIYNNINDNPEHAKGISPRSRVLGSIDATKLHTYCDLRMDPQINYVAWNFPFTGAEEDDSAHIELMLGTFLSLALFFGWKEKVFGKFQSQPQFIVALQGDQFSRWSVLRSARLAWWTLVKWGTFDCGDFPGYCPVRANGQPFPFEHPRFYVFELAHNMFG